MWDLVGNPEDRFSHDAAQMMKLKPKYWAHPFPKHIWSDPLSVSCLSISSSASTPLFSILGSVVADSGRASDSGGRGWGVRNLPLLCCVVGQDTLLPESTGNTQEAVTPSQHD